MLRGVERSRASILCHTDTRCSHENFACYALAVRDGIFYQFCVYILSSHSGTLYVGITGFFEQRILST